MLEMINKDIAMLEALKIKDGILDIVIDTDTYNEIDDQFAIVYALQSKERFNIKAVYACPFYKPEYNFKSDSPEDGMIKSYNEAKDLLEIMNVETENFLFKGSTKFCNETLETSESVTHLINLAMNNYTSENRLYVVGIGALTNLGNAIRIEPKIVDRITLVWLGGPTHASNRASEFNLHQDIFAVKTVFESNIPIIQIPCFGVTSHLLTSIHELKATLDLSIPIVKRLVDTYEGYVDNHFGYNKEIWDIAPIGFLIDPSETTKSYIVRRPTITYDETYSYRYDTPFMMVVDRIERNKIFADLFTKLNNIKVN